VRTTKPHGLAIGPHQNLLVGCNRPRSIVLDARNGDILANITKVGGSDEVWFNPGDHRFYLAANRNPLANGGRVLGVIDARFNQFIDKVSTAMGAHSVAANRANNHIADRDGDARTPLGLYESAGQAACGVR